MIYTCMYVFVCMRGFVYVQKSARVCKGLVQVCMVCMQSVYMGVVRVEKSARVREDLNIYIYI